MNLTFLPQAEVNSKAVAGLKMAQMTRTTQEKLLESQSWELRIKEATERRKAADKRLEEEKKLRIEAEEEVANLKAYLKESRKKQKDLTNERGSFHSMASGFDKERSQYEIAIATMQTNVRQLQVRRRRFTGYQKRVAESYDAVAKLVLTIE